jgi:hypothetical protein
MTSFQVSNARFEQVKGLTRTVTCSNSFRLIPSVYYNEFIERFGTERFASKVLLFGTQLADGAALRRPSKAIQIVEFFADGHRKQDSVSGFFNSSFFFSFGRDN